MKKFLLLVAMGSFCMAANAQWKFSLGPNAGVGGSWIDNFEKSKFKTHGNFGVSMIYSSQTNFGIGADIKYSLEGGEREFQTPIAGNTFTTTEEVNLNYLRIPVKAMFFFGKYGNRVRPKISVGPSFGFLMGGKTTAETVNQAGTVVNQTSYNSKDRWNGIDVGLHASGGLNYRLVQRTWFMADLVYYHGFSDIIENNSGNTKLHNRSLGVNIGVNFGL